MILVHFDGACWPKNPGGHIGWGYLIQETRQGRKKEIHQDCGYAPAGETSNNLAEYLAVYHAIVYLLANDWQRKKILIRGDSKLVIKQLQGKWKINHGVYTYVADRAQAHLQFFSNIKFQWIPREHNTKADVLTRYGLAKGGLVSCLENTSTNHRAWSPKFQVVGPELGQHLPCRNQLHLFPTVKPVSN